VVLLDAESSISAPFFSSSSSLGNLFSFSSARKIIDGFRMKFVNSNEARGLRMAQKKPTEKSFAGGYAYFSPQKRPPLLTLPSPLPAFLPYFSPLLSTTN
jgi:hypothetical protein